MKEIIKNWLDNSKERIKNPFLSSFIISFLICNWKEVSIYLFSSRTIESKITLISNDYSYWCGFWIPVLISLFYVIPFPYINCFFDFLVNKANQYRRNNEHKIKTEKLERKIIEAQLERQIAEKRAGTHEIESLKNELNVVKEESENRKSENVKMQSNYATEIFNLNSQKDKLSEEKEEFKNKYNDLEKIYLRENEIFQLLVKPNGDESDIEIRNFLRKTLRSSELSKLKRISNNETLNGLPFNSEVSSLLVKAGVFTYQSSDGSGYYYLNEKGSAFLLQL